MRTIVTEPRKIVKKGSNLKLFRRPRGMILHQFLVRVKETDEARKAKPLPVLQVRRSRRVPLRLLLRLLQKLLINPAGLNKH